MQKTIDINYKSGPSVRTVLRAREAGYCHEIHSHPEDEMVVNLKGNVTCTINGNLWIIPHQCALYIPRNTTHMIKTYAESQYCLIFLNPDRTKLAEKCCFFELSPLIKEMILHLSKMPINYHEDPEKLLFANATLQTLEQISSASYSMPIPYSLKLCQIADAMIANPADRTTLQQWAKQMGMSERNLARLIIRETGLTFGIWRQQFQIATALKELECGRSIQQIAWSLGYESVTAFITMFKKNLGKPPKKYLLETKSSQKGS